MVLTNLFHVQEQHHYQPSRCDFQMGWEVFVVQTVHSHASSKGAQGSGALPFFVTTQIVPSNSYTNFEKML